MAKQLSFNLDIPEDWDTQDLDIFRDMMQADLRDLMRTLIKYMDMKKNPGDVPKDFIEKHIKVAGYILKKKIGSANLKNALDYYNQTGQIP